MKQRRRPNQADDPMKSSTARIGVLDRTQIDAAAIGAHDLERDAKNAELAHKIINIQKEVQDDGNSKYTEQSRLFKRDMDAGKLYTQRFVRKLKASHRKVLQKFASGSNYAMKAMKR